MSAPYEPTDPTFVLHLSSPSLPHRESVLVGDESLDVGLPDVSARVNVSRAGLELASVPDGAASGIDAGSVSLTWEQVRRLIRHPEPLTDEYLVVVNGRAECVYQDEDDANRFAAFERVNGHTVAVVRVRPGQVTLPAVDD